MQPYFLFSSSPVVPLYVQKTRPSWCQTSVLDNVVCKLKDMLKCKDIGSQYFSQKKYANAVDSYTQALSQEFDIDTVISKMI